MAQKDIGPNARDEMEEESTLLAPHFGLLGRGGCRDDCPAAPCLDF